MTPWKRKEVIGNATPRFTAIYALCEFDSMEPRYVGKTVQYLHQRHKAHIRAAARPRLPVHYWLRKQASHAIKLLEYVPPFGDWQARERHWIQTLRNDGAKLLNLTEGGDGLAGHRFSLEHKQKIAAKLRTGSHCSCLTCSAVFWRKANEIAKGENKFCSKPCYFEWQRGKPKRNDSGLMGMAGRAAALEAKRRRRARAS